MRITIDCENLAMAVAMLEDAKNDEELAVEIEAMQEVPGDIVYTGWGRIESDA